MCIRDRAAGDVIEAVFLLRAYRTTLSRYGYTQPIDTGNMRLQRRISSTFKDVPGGQILGPTYDYTQRLLDFSLEAEREADALPAGGRFTKHFMEIAVGTLLVRFRMLK